VFFLCFDAFLYTKALMYAYTSVVWAHDKSSVWSVVIGPNKLALQRL